jgi:hypothetical protein
VELISSELNDEQWYLVKKIKNHNPNKLWLQNNSF